MPRVIKRTLISLRDALISAGPLLVLALLLLWGAYAWLAPAPPRKVVLLTGPEQSAYAEFGRQYAAELARYGITVELRATQGATENLRRLRDPQERIDVAFVEGGASDALLKVDEVRGGPALEALGTLFYEPVWLFYRDGAAQLGQGGQAAAVARVAKPANAARTGDAARAASPVAPSPSPSLTELLQRPGLRLNVGARGSGAPNLMRKLLHANRVDIDTLKTSRLGETEAVTGFLGGDLDALVFVSAPESPMVQMLLMTPGVRLFDFAQAEAYSRRLPFLTALTLPRGVVDLAQDVPPDDVRLIATTTVLVARVGTHPALEQLFVQAAHALHGGTGWFAHAGQFPVALSADWPMAAEAQRFYRAGAPLLQRYLPFWLANTIDRMWVVLVSIVAVLIPLTRVVPPLYQFRIRSRIYRWYARLRDIEDGMTAAGADPAALLAELNALDRRVEKLPVPLSHADELYALRGHIVLVRERLRGDARPVAAAVG